MHYLHIIHYHFACMILDFGGYLICLALFPWIQVLVNPGSFVSYCPCKKQHHHDKCIISLPLFLKGDADLTPQTVVL